MVSPTSSTHFPPFCPLSNIREWRTAKMATAVSAHFELQKCSSETYGWRHGHYVQVFYSLWVLHNVPAIYSCVKVIYLLIAAQGSLNSSLQQTMNVILRKCCLQSFISVSAASFWACDRMLGCPAHIRQAWCMDCGMLKIDLPWLMLIRVTLLMRREESHTFSPQPIITHPYTARLFLWERGTL